MNTTYTATYSATGTGNPALRAAYAFNDASGTNVSDASGNGLTGAIAGAAWATAGRFGGALSFDGIDDRVTVGSSPLLDLTRGTVEAWVRLDTLGRWHGVVAKGNANSERSHNYAIEIDSGNLVTCGIGNGTSFNAVSSTTQVAAQQFYHLACAWDGSQLRLYINGVLNRSVSQTITPAANSAPLFVGQYGGNADRFDGLIDEVRIYDVALSQAQIQSDMNTPVGTPPTDSTPPVQSNGQPAGTLPAGTTQATLSLATDEAATCRYASTAGVAYGSMTNVFATTGGTAHSTPLSGLANGGTYNYFVRCQDTATNANGIDYAISFSVAQPAPPDSTAPAVTLTAPGDGANVSATVTVTAAASDNVGVVGVEFLLDGAALGVEDTGAPYSVSWNTRTAANGAHTLSARARDAAGNRTTASVSVTVLNTATGLVAAFDFSEGTGSTTVDRSGTGNTGTIAGATWVTTGRYGNALSFDGVNDWVTVNDSSSLDLTTGMTLEAWVYPTALSGWRTAIMKEAAGWLAFALYAHDDAPRPAVWANIGGADQTAVGTGSLALNVWTHLAATYDGATVRLYVNGVQVGTRARVGSMAVSAQALRIGGNGVWGEYFSGRIDEVRIYNRALSPGEIQGDMNAPIR